MIAIGVVRGRIIELEQALDVPEGRRVEMEVRPLETPPLWGLLADKASMLDEIEAEVKFMRIALRTRVDTNGVLAIRMRTPFAEETVEVELDVRPVHALPKGTPGYKIAQLAGTLSDEAAEEMLRAIEEGCGQVGSGDKGSE